MHVFNYRADCALDDPMKPERSIQELEGVTALLREAVAGRGKAQERLAEVVYGDLRHLARQIQRSSTPSDPSSREATTLVHETWLRLLARGDKTFESRGHFFCVAARAMRGLLVDEARARGRRSAEGDTRLVLAESQAGLGELQADILDLEAALGELGELDPPLAELVELRFFTGLTVEEAAQSLNLSKSGAERQWRVARAWLHRRLSGGKG